MSPMPHEHVDEVIELAERIARQEVGRFVRILLDRLAPEPAGQAANYRIITKALEIYEERGEP